MKYLDDILIIIGIMLVSIGMFLIFIPAGFIFIGFSLFVLAYLLTRGGDD